MAQSVTDASMTPAGELAQSRLSPEHYRVLSLSALGGALEYYEFVAMEATRHIQAGWKLVNTPMLSLDPRLPFGGYRESDVGREGAQHSRHFYTEIKTVTIALSTPAMPKLGMA